MRESRIFAHAPDALFASAHAALRTIGASDVTVDEAARRADAVFTVFLFKDDVALTVEPDEEGAVLHIRSASRVGHYDFGVNRRRVNRFFRALERGA